MAYIPMDDAPPPFDAEWLDEQLEESRARVKKHASKCPGCWVWAKSALSEKYGKIGKYKANYDDAFESQDGAMCCKWLFAMERASMAVIIAHEAENHS